MILWKKYRSVGLAAVLAAPLLTGCSAGNDGNPGSTNAETESYVETDYGVPGLKEGEDSYNYPATMALLSDGTVRALISDDSEYGYTILDSTDGGATWTESEMDSSALSTILIAEDREEDSSGSYAYIYEAAFDSEGDLFFTYTVYTYSTKGNTETSDSETAYYLLTSDGNLTEIPMEIPGISKTVHEEYSLDEDDSEESGTDANDSVTDDADAGDSDTDSDADDSVTVSTGESEDDEYDYNGIDGVKLLDAENLFLSDYNGVIYHISLTDGSILGTIDGFDWVMDLTLNGDRLIILTESSAYEYDTETLTQTREHEALYDLFMDNNSFSMGDSSKDDGILYYVCSKGIFSYDLDTDTSVQIMDGSSTSLNSTMCSMNYLFAKEDGSFLVWFADYMTDGRDETLLNFSYDSAGAKNYDAELTIYSLDDYNYALETIASLYMRENSNVKVTVEYGATGEDAVTSSDAQRTLNTEIMAGEGPDLILLDGMDADTYMENGLLTDLSDTVQPMIDSGELMENIASTYKTDDGEIYAVPLGFSVPVIIGSEEIVSQINTLSDYASAAESYAATEESKDVSFIDSYTLSFLIGRMLSVNAASWIGEDGTLNEEGLTEYLEALQSVYQAVYGTYSEEEQENFETLTDFYQEASDTMQLSFFNSDIASDSIYLAVDSSDSVKLLIGCISYSDTLQYITSAQRMNESITYKSMPGTQENVYVPSYTVGINSKSEQQDAAKDFLEYMLSADGQEAALTYQNSFPVNAAALDMMLTNPYAEQEGYDPEESTGGLGIIEDDGTEIDMDLYWPNEEQISEFKELLNSLDTPAYTNENILVTIVLDCYASVTGGDVSIDEAVEQVRQDLSLYLSE